MPLDISSLRVGRSSLARAGGDRIAMLRRPVSAVSLIPLLERVTLTATVISGTIFEEKVITGEDFEDIGPHTQDLVGHAETRGRTGNFEWRVALQRKYLDADWTPTGANIAAADLVLGIQNVDGYGIGGPFNDRTRLGVKSRLLLQWRTLTGGAIGDKSEVSLSVAVRRWES